MTSNLLFYFLYDYIHISDPLCWFWAISFLGTHYIDISKTYVIPLRADLLTLQQ